MTPPGITDPAILYGVIITLAAGLGAAIGIRWAIPEAVLGVLLAFAAGALVTAAAYELLEPAYNTASAPVVTLLVIVGAAVAASANATFEGVARGRDGSGWPLLASATVSGIPDTLALGIVVLGGGGHGGALTVAIAAGVFPQAVNGAAEMVDAYTPRVTLAGWASAAVLLGAMVWVGATFFAGFGPPVLAGLRALAGGSILGGLASEIFPKAYDEASSVTAVATAVGFAVTFLLQ